MLSVCSYSIIAACAVRQERACGARRDVLGLIDAAGRDEAILIGHDWGAAVGWWAAVRAPERVAKLAVLNVAHPIVLLRHLKRNPRQMLRSWYSLLFLKRIDAYAEHVEAKRFAAEDVWLGRGRPTPCAA